MLHVLPIAALLLCLMPVLAKAQTGPEELKNSNISAVTVYRQGALVKRTGQVTLQEGEQDIAFTSLEQSIRSGTVQLAIAASVATFSIDVSTDPSRAPVEPDSLVDLRSRLDSLDVVLARLRANRAGYQEELAVIAANRDITGEKAAPALSAAAVRDAAKMYRELTTNAQIALAKIEVEERELLKIRQQLERRIGAIRPRPRTDIGRVTATVIAERAGTYNFELSYIVNNASWSPEYDLYLATESNVSAQLVLAANVQQATGVDWDKVRLTLSSSDINSRLAPTPLQPLYLGGRDVVSLASNAGGEIQAMKRDASKSDAPEAAMDMVVSAPATFASLDNTVASRLYTIDRPVTLAANGRSSSVKLTSYKLPLSLRYHAIPKREQIAYLEGIITSWDTLNLLAARMRLHLDDRYLGDNYFNPAQESDTLSVGLGPDPRIVVERVGRGQGSDTKLIRNRREYYLGYRITLRNTRNQAVDILVEDQIPTSLREEIEVKLEKATGNPSIDKVTGKITWQLSLKPATREELDVAYTIVAPKDVAISFE